MTSNFLLGLNESNKKPLRLSKADIELLKIMLNPRRGGISDEQLEEISQLVLTRLITRSSRGDFPQANMAILINAKAVVDKWQSNRWKYGTPDAK